MCGLGEMRLKPNFDKPVYYVGAVAMKAAAE